MPKMPKMPKVPKIENSTAREILNAGEVTKQE